MNASRQTSPGPASGRAPLPHPGTEAGLRPAIVGVGTAVPEERYTQQQVLDLFQVTDPRMRSVFLNGAIESRHLTMPPLDRQGRPVGETQGELLRKHTRQGTAIGSDAVHACLASAGLSLDDIGYLCCVSSTGLLTPGFSALLIKELKLAEDVSRLDVVGMGCNAGLNALNAVAGWSAANPRRVALMLCVEICSAAYVFDNTMRTAVVNSLFGDGAAALAVTTGDGTQPPAGPRLLRFASHIIPEASDAMRFDWDDGAGKYSFFLDRDIPYVVGANAETVIGRLLAGTGLRRSDIVHWLVHSGGKKVVDSARVNLGLTHHDVRHTTSVLREFGNLSSGSFLFSYERLLREGRVAAGEYGVMMTMGPGSTIETALIRF